MADPANPRLAAGARRLRLRAVMLACAINALGSMALAKEPAVDAPEEKDLAPPPAEVTVRPEAHDEEIRARLQRVLDPLAGTPSRSSASRRGSSS